MKQLANNPQRLEFKNRLHYRWEYRRFFQGSEAFRLSEAVVFRIQNEVNCFRLGITLKARGSSVERNRVKRVIREAFRRQSPQLGSYDYHVLIPAAKKMTYLYAQKLQTALTEEWPKILSKNQDRSS